MTSETKKRKTLEIYDRIVNASFNSKGEFDAEEFNRSVCDEISNFYDYPWTRPNSLLRGIKFAVEAYTDFLRQQNGGCNKQEKELFDLYRGCI